MNKKIIKRNGDYLKDMDRFIERLKKMSREEAVIDSFNALKRIGILDENGKIAAPYNGENVNSDDFTRGPKRIKCKR